MIFLILILLLLSLVIFVIRIRNLFIWSFTLSVVSITLSLFLMNIYVLRYGNYPSFWGPWQISDFSRLSLIAAPIRLSPFSLDYLFNGSLALYLLSTTFLNVEGASLYHESDRGKKRRSMIVILVSSLCYILYLFLICSPDFLYRIYISGAHTRKNLRGISAFVLINKAVLFSFIHTPLIVFVRIFRKTSLIPVKRSINLIGANLVLINGIFFYLFFVGSFRIDRTSTLLRMILGLDHYLYFLTSFDYLLSSLSIILILISLFLTLKLRHLGNLSLNLKGKRSPGSRMGEISDEMKGVFHYFKNTFFSLQLLINKSAETAGPGGTQPLEKALLVCNEAYEHLDRLMKYSKNSSGNMEKTCIAALLNKTLGTLSMPENIRVRREFNDTLRTWADPFQLEEVLRNLIVNALESLEQSGKERRRLKLSLFQEFGWIVIQVEDNGMGLDKKEITRMFDPFYSTKNRKMNWGIGLTYCHSVVSSHNGYIYAEGEPGVFARLTLLFPKSKGAGSYGA